MTTAIATKTNNNQSLAKPIAKQPVVEKKDNSSPKFNLQSSIKAANLDLITSGIRSKEQSELPSKADEVKAIKKKHGLDEESLKANGYKKEDVEIHFHKQKDPKTNEVMFHPITRKPLKIAEFVDKHHTCSEHDKKALHQPEAQKKTSTCTGPSCKPEQSKPKGFFQNLFSTAA